MHRLDPLLADGDRFPRCLCGGYRVGGSVAPERPAERTKALPYYRWWVQDYRGSRNVQRLTWQEKGIYRELIDECWDKGSIPDDLTALADIVGCAETDMAGAWTKLRRLFEVNADGMLVSPRLEKERSAEDRERLVKAAAGRKGGIASGVSRAKQNGSSASVLPSSATKHEASSSEQFTSEQFSSGARAASPLEGLSLALCPWCKAANGHTPDCRPSRLSPQEAT